jgi:beta-galactosidase
LRADYSGKPPQAGVNDVIFVYAEITDKNGNRVMNYDGKVLFMVEGDAKILQENLVTPEAGIATVLLQIGNKKEPVKIHAHSFKLLSSIEINPI